MNYARFLPLAAFLLLIGALAALLTLRQESMAPAVKQLPAFSLPPLSVKETPFTNKDITRPSLIHVAASWCASCKIDFPLLLQLKERGVPIYGVMWKDRPNMVIGMILQRGNPYKKIAMDDGRFSINIGLTGTPETLLVDEDGNILLHVRGPLSPEFIQQEIMPRLFP